MPFHIPHTCRGMGVRQYGNGDVSLDSPVSSRPCHNHRTVCVCVCVCERERERERYILWLSANKMTMRFIAMFGLVRTLNFELIRL